jgi:hypothetical protein
MQIRLNQVNHERERNRLGNDAPGRAVTRQNNVQLSNPGMRIFGQHAPNKRQEQATDQKPGSQG